MRGLKAPVDLASSGPRREAFCFRSLRARAGQLVTAHLARVISSGGMASLRTMG